MNSILISFIRYKNKYWIHSLIVNILTKRNFNFAVYMRACLLKCSMKGEGIIKIEWSISGSIIKKTLITLFFRIDWFEVFCLNVIWNRIWHWGYMYL